MSALPTPRLTLEQAREGYYVLAKGKGTHCPCCDRWGKYNPAKLSSATCGRILLWFRAKHVANPNAWVDIRNEPPKWLLGRSMHARLKHWELLERKPKDPEHPKDKTSGLWRITADGIAFAEGRLYKPETAWVYKDTLIRLDGPKVGIRHCIEGFDYAEMMSGQFNDKKV